MKLIKIIIRITFAVSIILLLALFPFSNALASTSGPNYPGSGANMSGVGTELWQNPDEITSPGSPYASVTLTRDFRYSNYLQATDFSFNIPERANIIGIQMMINRMATGRSPSIYDNVVSLVKAGANPGESVIVGFNKASPLQWPRNTLTTAVYGSSTDLWGTTWTPDEINDPGFGMVLAVFRQDLGNLERSAAVNYVQMTVYFTIGSATTNVDCGDGVPVITYGDDITCKATVIDSELITPIGSVSWTTDGNGSFTPFTCDLVEVSIGVSACEVIYSPNAAGINLITANYSGDVNFDPNSGDELVTIDMKLATVTPNAALKTYGETDPALTGTLEGFLVGDNVTAVYSREAGETVLGGPYTITAVLSPTAVLGNYDITYHTAEFTINPRPVTITADAKTKIVGQPDPALTYQITAGSLVFGDSETGALSRDPGEAVGTYAIRQGTLALNSNYLLTYVGANLTITYQTIYLPIILR